MAFGGEAAIGSTHVHIRYVSHGSCNHVHKEFTCPYMVQRRWVLTGGSCSYVYKECACLYRGTTKECGHWRELQLREQGVCTYPCATATCAKRVYIPFKVVRGEMEC
jgi:hypothetical protein